MKKRILSIFLVFSMVLSLLSFTVSADDTARTFATKRYTVLLLDTASERRLYPNGIGGSYITVGASLAKVKQASSKFVQQVLSANGENYVAIVSFDSTATIRSRFSKDYDALNKTISDIRSGIWTDNANQALTLADELLKGVTDQNAIKNVLYFSGGLPSEGTYSTSGNYSREDYNWVRIDNNKYFYAYCNPVYATAELLKKKGYNLYTLGCFTNLSEQPATYNFTIRFMKDIQNGGFYDAQNPDDLEFVFGDIANDIISKRTGTFSYQAKNAKEEDYKATYFYDDNYFSEDASSYKASLATMSLCFELSAWGSNVAGKTDYSNKSRNARELLDQIGFVNFETNSDFTKKPQEDTMGVVAAHKDIKVNGKPYTLIALATRGGGYEAEWAGNFTIGPAGQHEGFKRASDEAYRFLADYMNRHRGEFKKDIKFWFAGYSRGGATVNMLAGRLDDEGQIAGINFKKEDLYAYCFEPPMGALESQVSTKEKYTNIHNIVNPSDIVPKVAPRAWGFARYGKDEPVIPSKLNYSNSAYFDKMLEKFKSLDTEWVHESLVNVDGKEKHIVDTFQAKRFDPNVKLDIGHWEERTGWFGIKYWAWVPNFKVDARLIANYDIPMSLALDQLMISLSSGIGSRQNYTDKLQKAARLAAAQFMADGYESYKWNNAFNIFNKKVNEHILDIAVAYVVSGEKGAENLVMEYLYNSISEAGIDLSAYGSIPKALGEALNVIVRTVVASASLNDGNDLLTLLCDNNYKKLFPAHYPELCLAWLQMQDKNYTPEGEKLFVINSYRVVRINCPVDVSVYNSKGALVAQIINDVPQKIGDSTIVSTFNADGEKVVYLPADENYDVKILATGNGKLNYSVNEFSYDTDSYAKIVNYYDIPITAGDKLSGVVPKFLSEDKVNTGEGSKVEYALSSSKGELEPSKELVGKLAEEAIYSVQVESNNSEGGTTFGGGTYSEGSFAQVAAKAYEKCEFDGWYEKDVLVSKDSVYRFQVKKDTNLIAKFKGNRPNPQKNYTVSIPSSKTLQVGGSYTIKPIIKPSGLNSKFIWKSSKPTVATVSSLGKITAKAAGTAIITVTAENGKKVSCKVVVKAVKVTSITLSATSKIVKVGGSVTLKPLIKPTNATIKTLLWKSSNVKIATVDSKGKIKGKKAGKVTVTAYAKDGSGKKGSITLTIKK